DRQGDRARSRPHRQARDQRRADPDVRVPRALVEPGLRDQGVRDRPRSGDHLRRDRDPGTARPGADEAARQVELVDAGVDGQGAVPPPGRAGPEAGHRERLGRGGGGPFRRAAALSERFVLDQVVRDLIPRRLRADEDVLRRPTERTPENHREASGRAYTAVTAWSSRRSSLISSRSLAAYSKRSSSAATYISSSSVTTSFSSSSWFMPSTSRLPRRRRVGTCGCSSARSSAMSDTPLTIDAGVVPCSSLYASCFARRRFVSSIAPAIASVTLSA